MTTKILVLIGPSGAGKSTLARYLVDNHGYTIAKTFTTRPQRNKYEDDHIFINEDTFFKMKSNNEYIGTLSVFKAHYGLPFFDITQKTIVLLRAPAVKEFLSHYKDSLVIQLVAPLDILIKRLEQRNSHDRIDEESLLKEIEIGNDLANITIDSVVTIPECARLVMEELEDAQ